MGERTPHLDPNARAAFVGLTASHTLDHLTRAVLEGVAFSLRDSLEIFREIGAPIDRIRVGGGGARSALWRQIQADVYARPVETVEAEEGAAFGAAILAGVGVGAWPSVKDASDQVIRVAGVTEPIADPSQILDRSYKAYRMLYEALRPVSQIVPTADGDA
jgi:xylulokinase